MMSTRKQAGDYDRSFGQEGNAELPDFFGPTLSRQLTAMVLQGDNILASAQASDNSGRSHYAITRLTPMGNLDTAFGVGGKVVDRFNQSEHSKPEALAVLSDGTIAMLGFTSVSNPPAPKPMLLLLDQDGSPLNPPFALELPEDAAMVNGSGRLTASGSHFLAALNLSADSGMPSPKPRVYRMDLNGEPGFPHGRFIEIQVARDEGPVEIGALVQLEDGFFVSGSHVLPTGSSEGFIARYDNDGVLDGAFGEDGIIAFQALGQATRITTLLRRPNGSLAVAGHLPADEKLPRRAFHWQFTAQGTIDPAFNQGKPVVDGEATAWYSASLDGNGRLITFGIGETYLYRRYLLDGSIDPDYHPAAALIGNQEAVMCLYHGRNTLLGYNATAAIGVIGTVTAIQN